MYGVSGERGGWEYKKHVDGAMCQMTAVIVQYYLRDTTYVYSPILIQVLYMLSNK